MILLLSPSKTQDFETAHLLEKKQTLPLQKPYFQTEIENLVALLKKFDTAELESLMQISPKLALLNQGRFKTFDPTFERAHQQKPAIFAFQGDVYEGLEARDFSEKELLFAQKHLLILSGLYGILQPLDSIQPYRLEMKTALKGKVKEGESDFTFKNLYEFWGEKLSQRLLALAGEQKIVNLASQEYFKAIQTKSFTKKLKEKVINIHFKEKKGNRYSVVAIFAKKARGRMARFAIQHQIQDPEALKSFQDERYQFLADLSTECDWVFGR
ncbi:peroxide stress protein YaaA [Hugenholtzia roseola]|uniref:peroxide stress protein YaaA n=1 Tax=Hugenholtzia roseola TaxID=1002 RepID=UPI00047AD2BE|nr:peroxide stress protein YaaA [Hugenholtzia roseola]